MSKVKELYFTVKDYHERLKEIDMPPVFIHS